MNKSKFLKKSLAMLLAVMLVVAMIPLSASAALVNDKYIVQMTADTGTLTGSANTWKDAVPYTGTEETITLELKSNVTTVYTKIGDETEFTAEEGLDIALTGLQAGDTEKITFFVADDEYDPDAEGGTKSPEYTIDLTVATASRNTDIETATATVNEAEIEGKVNNTAKTITFVMPWSDTEVTVPATVSVLLKEPVEAEKAVDLTPDDKGVIDVTSQNGDTTKYTVIAEEAACLKSLSIGGVKAVANVDEEGVVSETDYTVSLPVGTDLEKELPIVFSTGKPATAKFGETTVESGKSYVFAEGEKEFVLTEKDTENAKTYKVTVEITKSDDAAISAFTAKVGEYTENGTVKGDKLTVELPSTTDSLGTVALNFTVATGATIKAAGKEFTNGNSLDVTKPVVIAVTAPDGTTTAYYELTATIAAKPNTDPEIKTAKMVLDGVDHMGKVEDETSKITFSDIPYSTDDTALQGADYSFAPTAATQVDFDKSKFAFEGENEVKLTSDNGDVVTYAVVFVKADAETGKTLSKFSLTSAAKETDVTAENTYAVKVSADKVSGTLPYSLYNLDAEAAKEAKLVAQFTLSKGAKLYNTDNDGKNVQIALESGFDATTGEGLPKATITVANLLSDAAAKAPYIVADETAAVALDAALADGGIAVADLKKAPYKGHVTVLVPEVKSAPASKEKDLKTLGDAEGKVTSKIDGAKGIVEVSVPGSYAEEGAAAFTVVLTASAGATIMVNDDKTVVPATGEMSFKVVGEKLMKADGTTAVEKILVKSEAGETKVYSTVKTTVRKLETGAAITALKANKTSATISGKNITVTLPLNTDITKVALNVTLSSKMAEMEFALEGKLNAETEETEYDLTKGVAITVTSEDGKTVNKYKLTATVADQFPDVKEGKWYYDYVTQAAEAGIVRGNPDGTFKPENKVSRRDFAIMTVRMLGVDVSGYTTAPFSDVKSTDYGVKEIAYCAEKGIIGGYGDGTFKPAQNINRMEAAKILAEALSLEGTTSEKFKDDAKIDNWAKPYVYACKAAGVFGGDNGNFLPKDMITRAETAKVMVKSLDNK